MGKIGTFIYGRPLEQIVILMCILLFAWTKVAITMERKKQNAWKVINGFLFFCGMAVIFFMTVRSRDSDVYQVVLRPFASFAEARTQPEIYRSMFMNIFLFFPLGLTLPYALPEKWKRNTLLTTLFALVLSITIEYLQYHYHLGRAETDDVLCNTLGAFIGTLSYTLSRKFDHK